MPYRAPDKQPPPQHDRKKGFCVIYRVVGSCTKIMVDKQL